jgi:uncharacterized protein YegP (UPF0339 family)
VAAATKKVRFATSPDRAGHAVPEVASLKFRIYRDNGGDYHREIVDVSGENLTRSESFASDDHAESPARYVREGARSTRFELHVREQRQTVAV